MNTQTYFKDLQIGDFFKLSKNMPVMQKTEPTPIPKERLNWKNFKDGWENELYYNARYESGPYAGSFCCIYDGNKAEQVIRVDKV